MPLRVRIDKNACQSSGNCIEAAAEDGGVEGSLKRGASVSGWAALPT